MHIGQYLFKPPYCCICAFYPHIFQQLTNQILKILNKNTIYSVIVLATHKMLDKLYIYNKAIYPQANLIDTANFHIKGHIEFA